MRRLAEQVLRGGLGEHQHSAMLSLQTATQHVEARPCAGGPSIAERRDEDPRSPSGGHQRLGVYRRVDRNYLELRFKRYTRGDLLGHVGEARVGSHEREPAISAGPLDCPSHEVRLRDLPQALSKRAVMGRHVP